jgi:kumamolisin
MRRETLSTELYAQRFGASQPDLGQVSAFLESGGLTISETHPASRTMLAAGTVAQFSTLFSIVLDQYEAPSPRGEGMQAYRSHEGPIHVPAELADCIIGVFGLDNRRFTGRNSNDPPATETLSVQEISQFYSFPTSTAAGQTIGIVSYGLYEQVGGQIQQVGGGYAQNDISRYFSTYVGGRTAPTPVPVHDIDGTTNFSSDSETTQDICIASTVAEGATIAVYFNKGDENGWLGVMQHATFPSAGDPAPSVLSSSFFICNGDDAAGRGSVPVPTPPFVSPTNPPIPTSFLDALSLAFQDAGGQGLTVCIASGDAGADSNVSDGNPHVQYPGSDPWVLSCGGTTVGRSSAGAPSFVQYVWDEPGTGGAPGTGATGGGVSAYFAQPEWQFGLTGLQGSSGRGVPDVAGNASPNSGYPIFVGGQPFTAHGTSAVAPLYAGLFAVINAALGTRVGFINPVLYALGNTVCDDVDPTNVSNSAYGGPLGNTYNNVVGYFAGPGWDACTGWGSINGNALLGALQAPQILTKECTFIVDRSTYGKDEVDALLKQAPGNAIINPALWVVVDGYTPGQLHITSLSGTPHFPPSITMTPSQPASFQFVAVALESDDPSLPGSVQRFTFAYQALFTGDTAFASLTSGQQTLVTLTAAIQASTSPPAAILLVNEPDPFITNGATSWLSIDLRVFSILQYESRFNANLSSGTPNQFIQTAIANLTTGKGTTASGDSFEMLPVDEEPNIFVYPTTFVGGIQVPVFNFAIARVRYRNLTTDAIDVRVFFRMFQAQSTNTSYDQSSTYRRVTNHETPAQPIPVLGVNASEFVTIPLFATPRVNTNNNFANPQGMDYQTDDPFNVQTIPHDPSGAEVDAYFGCWLDLNQTSPQSFLIPTSYQPGNLNGPWDNTVLGPIQQAILKSHHQCLVAEIALDPSFPQIPTGATPSDSDKLAQRNLGWSDLAL